VTNVIDKNKVDEVDNADNADRVKDKVDYSKLPLWTTQAGALWFQTRHGEIADRLLVRCLALRSLPDLGERVKFEPATALYMTEEAQEAVEEGWVSNADIMNEEMFVYLFRNRNDPDGGLIPLSEYVATCAPSPDANGPWQFYDLVSKGEYERRKRLEIKKPNAQGADAVVYRY
jgi:hypothetical protein